MAAATAEAKNGHRLLSFEELSQLPPYFEDVSLPELGDVTVRLFAITGLDLPRLRARWNESAKKPDDEELDLDVACEIIAAAWPDSTVEGVRKLPGPVINRLFTVALRLSGIGNAALQAALNALKGTPSVESGSA